MYELPPSLVPRSTLGLQLPGGELVEVPKAEPIFELCVAPPLVDSFGGKPFVRSDDGPCFAELLITRLLRKHGWNARWIETYPPRRGLPLFLRDWVPRGIAAQQAEDIADPAISGLLHTISAARGAKYSGCWDVIAWQGSEVLFLESKRAGRDRLNLNQIEWLNASLQSGLDPNNFLVVEWSTA